MGAKKRMAAAASKTAPVINDRMARYARYARGAVYCPVCSACEAACTVRDDHARYYRCRVCGHRFAVPIETESA